MLQHSCNSSDYTLEKATRPVKQLRTKTQRIHWSRKCNSSLLLCRFGSRAISYYVLGIQYVAAACGSHLWFYGTICRATEYTRLHVVFNQTHISNLFAYKSCNTFSCQTKQRVKSHRITYLSICSEIRNTSFEFLFSYTLIVFLDERKLYFIHQWLLDFFFDWKLLTKSFLLLLIFFSADNGNEQYGRLSSAASSTRTWSQRTPVFRSTWTECTIATSRIGRSTRLVNL